MEMEPVSTEAIAKKLWHVIRVAFMMVRKGFAKSKLLLDLTLILKRTNKLAGKALHSFLLPHHHVSFAASTVPFSCQSSNDAVHSFVSPKDYEFSCSSSPAYPLFHLTKRSKLHRHRRQRHRPDEAATMEAVQRVLEMIGGTAGESSVAALSGLRRSPAAGCRQLRVTDSPFPVKESEEESVQVNEAADEFIRRFYRDLRRQKSLDLDSPYHDTWTY